MAPLDVADLLVSPLGSRDWHCQFRGEKLIEIVKMSAQSADRPPVRGYIDGCFDIMHSGHYNAIRQAQSMRSHATILYNLLHWFVIGCGTLTEIE